VGIARRTGLAEDSNLGPAAFQNMSDDIEQDYFCDGIIEDIITGLARIKWLFVIGQFEFCLQR
jgi:TolB-like protein